MRRLAKLIGLTFIGCYSLLCASVRFFESALLFPAPKSVGFISKAKVIRVPSGTPMLWVPPPPGGAVLVFFHGNADQIANAEFLANAFAEYHFGFAAVEYPGYPNAPGEPSEAAMVEAGERALEHLSGPMGIAKDRLVLFGQSLGTGIAVQLAAKGWGRALVLVTPYTSIVDVAHDAIPYVPMRLLLRNAFDSEALAPSIKQPVMIVHGDRDEVVPYEQGQALGQRFVPPALFVTVPDATHNEALDRLFVFEAIATFVLHRR